MRSSWAVVVLLLVLAGPAAYAQDDTEIPKSNAEPKAALATSKCLPACFDHGTCNEELGRCDCVRGKTGFSCSQDFTTSDLTHMCEEQFYSSKRECLKVDQPCLNNCNQRGVCMSGVCKCRPGTWGADCALSRTPEGKVALLHDQGYKVRQKRPHVYVYELPPEFNTWSNTRRLDRPLHMLFWQRLLSSGARVADPELADWFFIPMKMRSPRDSELFMRGLEYINMTWPYMQRFNNTRHFAFHLGDLGLQEMTWGARKAMMGLTWLTHWGLHEKAESSGWQASHRPEQDIVVPVYISPHHFGMFGMTRSPLHRKCETSPRRRITLFFAGRICGDRKEPRTNGQWPNCGPQGSGYSSGIRQLVHFHHHKRENYTITTRVKGYDQHLIRSLYCLAPPGGGHGQRQILVSFMGCIPVTIGDNIYQPFEPHLDWSQFAVQPREYQIPQLNTLLGSISTEHIEHMQRSLSCAAQHLLWSSITGGFMGETGQFDAFETVLEILRMKGKFPDALAYDYPDLDLEYRQFMACGADVMGEAINNTWVQRQGAKFAKAQTTDNPLCSHSYFDGREPSCYRCMRGASSTHGVPGGHMCCGRQNKLGQCPRVWD